MTGIGLVLLIVGFAFVIPSGAFPGSTAHRNIKVGQFHVENTRGHTSRAPAGWRRTLLRVTIGLGIMVLGALAMDRGLKADESDRSGLGEQQIASTV